MLAHSLLLYTLCLTRVEIQLECKLIQLKELTFFPFSLSILHFVHSGRVVIITECKGLLNSTNLKDASMLLPAGFVQH